MKKIIISLLFYVPLFCAPLFSPPQAVIQGDTPQALRTYLENIRMKGRGVSVSDAQKTYIKNKLLSIGVPEYWIDQILDPNAPFPPVEPTRGGIPGAAGGAGVGGYTPSGIPSTQPSAPVSTPTIPSLAPGIVIPQPSAQPVAPSIPEVPAQPVKKPDEDLTNDQLTVLPDAQKMASDQAVIALVKATAQEPLAGDYVDKFKKRFVALLNNKSFLSRKNLKAFIADGGGFDQMMNVVRTSDDAILPLYDMDPAQLAKESNDLQSKDVSGLEAPQALIKHVILLMQTCLINAALLYTSEIIIDVRTILLNLSIVLKPIQPSQSAQIISDVQAANAVQEVIGQAEKDVLFNKAQAANAQLSHDYIEMLIRSLSRLVMNPQFLKVYGAKILSGKGTLLNPDGGLLVLLNSHDATLFNPRRIRGAIAEQLFYNPEKLDDVLPGDGGDILKAICSDHARRLKAVKVPAAQALADLENAKSIFDIRSKVIAALARVSDAEQDLMNAIIKELAAPQPDAVLIADKLRALNLSPASIAKVKKTISDAQKQLEIAAQVKKILEEAKAKRARGEDINAWLLDALKQKNLLKTQYQQQAFSGAERTYASAYGVLKNLIGQAALQKMVTVAQFYDWLYEYGVLMKLLRNVPSDAKGLKEQQAFDRLLLSLAAMNTANIQANQTYFPVITLVDSRATIDAGKYKGKLDGIIQALQNFDLATFKDLITKYVAQAGTGLENSTEFNEIMTNAINFLVETMANALASQLQSLATGGEYQVAGLELKGKDAERNALTYDVLKGLPALKTLADAFKNGVANFDVAQFKNSIDAAKQSIQSKIDAAKSLAKFQAADKDSAVKMLSGYLDSLADRVQLLKQMMAPAVPEPAQLSDIPLAPDDVPAAPDMDGVPVAPEAPPF